MEARDWLLLAVLGFGTIALITTARVRTSQKREFDVFFVKLFGLLFVATLAVAVVFTDLSDDARIGAYTILGTIAGYLAGSKVPTEAEKKEAAETPGDGGSQGA